MSKKPTHAEHVLGRALFREVQNRLPQGARLTIPAKSKRPRRQYTKGERNKLICSDVLHGGMSRADAARKYDLSPGRITRILAAADRWLAH